MKIYDLGYQSIKNASLLVQVVNSLNAIVVDVRLSPRSRDPQWNRKALLTSLGERYVHVEALGNLNYKVAAPIVIKDLPAGLLFLGHYLELGPVILLCACWDRHHCHRKVILDYLESKCKLVSIPLDLAACRQLITKDQPRQLGFFSE